MMTIHRPGRSVGRSVGHTGRRHYSATVAACLNVSRLGLSIITQQRGASPVLALPRASGSLTEESTGWTFSREKLHPLTVSIAGDEPAGVFWFCVRLSHASGGLPLHPWAKTC